MLRRRPPLARACPMFAALACLAVHFAPSPRASVTCEEVGGAPGRETTVRLIIESPAEGEVVVPSGGCGGEVIVRGRWLVDGPPLSYDFYFVIDASGSADRDSGADVDGDGVFGEADDTIYMAEITAAQEFIRVLDPATARVAVIVFNRAATLRQPLTADLPAAIQVLETMKGDRPRWGTGYVPAMEAVRLEMLARGDRENRRQRCIFLSDGQPTETLAQTDAKASELAALGMVLDTFALGFPDSEALRNMAALSGGTFTPLISPGDIVALLPSFVPDIPVTLSSREDLSGSGGSAVLDDGTGTFEARIPVRPGDARLSLTLEADGDPPVVVTCTVDVVMAEALVPDAGPPVEACGLGRALLDASASQAACAAPLFRWTGCGAPLSDWSPDPLLDVAPCELACAEVSVEIACPGEDCVAVAATRAACVSIAPPEPAVLSSCGMEVVLTCGSADPFLEITWDLDPAVDADGNGDPTDDADASGCDVAHVVDRPGAHEVVAWAIDPASGCRASARLGIVATPHPPARRIDGGLCPGETALFSCGTAEPGLSYWWDFDDSIDADGDGDPTADRDAAGCDAGHAWPADGSHVVHGWAEDASGCRRLVAAGVMSVSSGATPGEAHDLRVSRSGEAVTLAWSPTPGAAAHRVLRGDLLLLHATRAYDHAADDSASRGACEIRGRTSFTDPDDAADPESHYYLVVALNDCAGEGPTGHASDRRTLIPRPARVATASCP